MTAFKELRFKRMVRMSKCDDSKITCTAKFNGKQVPVPSTWTWDAMQNTVDMQVTDIHLEDLESKAETANDLVDFAVTRVPMQGLKSIYFSSWKVS